MIKRIIRWQIGPYRYARGFIFNGYGKSFADYAKLVEEARKDFPSLTEKDIDVGRVIKSAEMNQFIAVAFRLEPAESHPAYEVWDHQDFELI